MKLDHCAAHTGSADLGMSCYRIRHDDGRIATPAEIWAAMFPRDFEIANNGFGDNVMMDIEAELRGYAVDHAPDGWPAIRMDKLMQAANEIDRLRAETATLRALIARYRSETPLGHQPHMIAHEVDKALETPNAVVNGAVGIQSTES